MQNGVDVKTLSHMLGHFSSGFTLDTYTHVTARMQQEAAEKMGSLPDDDIIIADPEGEVRHEVA